WMAEREMNQVNNRWNESSNVTTQVDLSITKTGPATATSGQNVVYTVTVSNNGPSPATSVVISDPTPASMSFVSNSGACATAYPCNVGTLNAGQTATITSTFSTGP